MQGWSVWLDQSIPIGKSYENVIEVALEEAQCVIVIWSKTSVKSEWVRAEAAEAHRQGKLFPLKEMAYGLSSHTPESTNAERVLKFNRNHRGVESHHYMLDWNWNEDRCTISTNHGAENITCLRRFATGLIKSIHKKDSVSSTIKKLARNVRQVFDYLRMTENSRKFVF